MARIPLKGIACAREQGISVSSLLEAAVEAVAELDRERGRIDENGEPVGHGETIAGLALEMRREVFGPEGKD